MNRFFWLLHPSDSESCENIELLLPLYADSMASPEETRRIEAHLLGCEGCRAALAWIQATQRTLAARPVVLPPPDLHGRIARAIAAASAAPSLRPVRTFRLRPAYAAAASLSVLGLVLGYSLWQAPTGTTLKPMPGPTHMAAAPHPAAKTISSARPLHPVLMHPRTVVARNAPAVDTMRPVAIKRLPTLKKPVAVSENRVASAVPALHVPVITSALHPVETSSHALLVHNMTAKIAPAEMRLPVQLERVAPKQPAAPLVADRLPAPVEVHILPPTLIPQPPAVQTASSTAAPPPSQLGDILGPVKAHIGQMRTAAFLTTGRSYRGAANAVHSLDTEHFAYVDGIHSP